MKGDFIKIIKFIYDLKITEGKKISPYESRLNPGVKSVTKIETREEEHNFLGTSENNEYDLHQIDLSNDEFITRVQVVQCAYISRLDITTNFGRKFTIGHDYPEYTIDPEITVPQNMIH